MKQRGKEKVLGRMVLALVELGKVVQEPWKFEREFNKAMDLFIREQNKSKEKRAA